jgi:hypothetical protein
MNNDDVPVPGDTCFSAHARFRVECPRATCNYWIENPETQNCSLLAAQHGGMTLEAIGSFFGLTRMRVCQIEKNIYQKIMTQLEEHQS